MSKSPSALKTKFIVPILFAVLALWCLVQKLLADPSLSGFEKDIFLAIYNLPQSLRWIVLLITQFGSFWLIAGLVIGLFIKHSYNLAYRLSFSIAVSFILIEFLKRLIDRPRPPEALGTMHYEFSVSGSAFPSGHTAFATAASLTVWPYVPKNYHWILVLWPLLVGFSRIYLGVHAPLDIIGGFAVGIIVAFVQKMIHKIPPLLKLK